MKNRRWWILLAAIAVLTLPFLFLKFHAAVSDTQGKKNVTTTSIGNQLPDTVQRKDKISVAVVGQSPLVSALRKALPEEMHRVGMNDIEMVQELEPAYQNPALVVKVEDPSLFWTPFFATSRFSVQAGYASSGDTTFMGKTPIIMDNRDGRSFNIYAEYKIQDSSWGLISRQGYHQMLADYLAEYIVASLKDIH